MPTKSEWMTAMIYGVYVFICEVCGHMGCSIPVFFVLTLRNQKDWNRCQGSVQLNLHLWWLRDATMALYVTMDLNWSSARSLCPTGYYYFLETLEVTFAMPPPPSESSELTPYTTLARHAYSFLCQCSFSEAQLIPHSLRSIRWASLRLKSSWRIALRIAVG